MKPQRTGELASTATAGPSKRSLRAARPAPAPLRAASLDPRLAAAIAALLSAAEPIILQWLARALAIAGAPGENSPLLEGSVGPPGPAVYTIDEAAKRVRLGRSFLYNQAALGHLVLRKCGSRSLIDAANLDAFVAALPKFRSTAQAAKGPEAAQTPAPERPNRRGGRR